MASISTNKSSGLRRIVVQVDDTRKAISVGQMRMKSAIYLRDLCQDLADCAALGKSLDPDLAEKVRKLSPDIHDQLARIGLVRGVVRDIPMKDVLQRFIDQRKMNPGTRKTYEKVISNLNAFFPGAQFDIVDDEFAGLFRKHLDREYARATASRRIKACRTIWAWAIAHDFSRVNPWKAIEAGQQVNNARKEYVAVETVEQLIAAAGDEMKLVLTLARFCGLRTPSEIAALRWEDIDLRGGTMRITSVKTSHHEGHEDRYIPIFHQSRKIVERLHRGTGPVLTSDLSNNTLRKRLLKLCHKCGVKPWLKLFHNLRASCETDLMSDHAAHVVAKWMGHSLAIAEKHYLTINPMELEKATRQTTRAVAIEIAPEVTMKSITAWETNNFANEWAIREGNPRRAKASLKKAYKKTGDARYAQARA